MLWVEELSHHQKYVVIRAYEFSDWGVIFLLESGVEFYLDRRFDFL